MSATTGSFSIGNSTVQMPVKAGALGPSVVDIGKLYTQSGMFTYDPGFTLTASCESEVGYIDGEEGVLLYRGYSIEQIAEHGDPAGNWIGVDGRPAAVTRRPKSLVEQLVQAWVVAGFDPLVRPEGACHQWREIPPRELSVDLVADERLGRAIGRAGAS